MAKRTLPEQCGKCGHPFRSADEKTDHDASRNITKSERLAMFHWGRAYAQSGQSARCFFRSLALEHKKLIRDQVEKILEATND